MSDHKDRKNLVTTTDMVCNTEIPSQYINLTHVNMPDLKKYGTQHSEVEGWKEEFARDYGALLNKPICCERRNNECGCDGDTYLNDIIFFIEDLLTNHSTKVREECLCKDKGVIELVEAERSEIKNAFEQVVKGQPGRLFLLPKEVTKVVGYVSVPELGEVAYKGQEIDLMALVNETLALPQTDVTKN